MIDAVVPVAVRLLLDLVCLVVLVHGVYLRRGAGREQTTTLYLLNLVTFGLTVILSGARVEVGAALGLFAVFGLLRYRTEALRIRDLTYLFMAIGLAVLNGVAVDSVPVLRAALVDVVLLVTLVLLERRGGGGDDAFPVVYDRLDLLAPARREALLSDLSTRLGMPATRVEVGRIDLLRETAELTVLCTRGSADR